MLQSKFPAKLGTQTPASPQSQSPYTATPPSRTHAHTPAASPASPRQSTPRPTPPRSPHFSTHPTASFYRLRPTRTPSSQASGAGNQAPHTALTHQERHVSGPHRSPLHHARLL